jgi:hypothetical protein
MTEGEVAAHGNVEIARLTIDWPFPRVKPRLLCPEFHSMMGKWRREITYDRVLRIRRNESSGILVEMRFVEGLDERPDIDFIFRRVGFQCCG